jgi:hypothetical protein
MSRRSELLYASKQTITRDRNKEYGGPENSFALIADYWSSYLGHPISTVDVALMMSLLKVARLQKTQGAHTDSWVDLAGYAACGYEVSPAPAIPIVEIPDEH